MARKSKPSTPEQILQRKLEQRRKDFEAVELPADAADLPQNEGIEITRAGQGREGQKVQADSARRLDAFLALKDGMQTGCYDAARRYEEQLLIRRGENDRGPSRERVDQTAGFTTDAMIDAARWIEGVNKHLPPRDWWLLMELIRPSVPRDNWRDTVALITGETHTHAQGAAVRSMTVNLKDAIEAVDKGRIEQRRAA